MGYRTDIFSPQAWHLPLRSIQLRTGIRSIGLIFVPQVIQWDKKLQHRDKLIGLRDTVNAYNTKIVNAHDAFYSQPVIDQDKYETIQLVLDKTVEDLDLDFASISTPSYSSGVLGFEVIAQGSKEEVQKLPSLYIDNLLDEDFSDNNDYYSNASYSGYNVNIVRNDNGDIDEDKESVSFSVTMAMNGRESAYKPEKSDN